MGGWVGDSEGVLAIACEGPRATVAFAVAWLLSGLGVLVWWGVCVHAVYGCMHMCMKRVRRGVRVCGVVVGG